jgi:transcriptional regulator with PAS, ATPase and Fis domain
METIGAEARDAWLSMDSIDIVPYDSSLLKPRVEDVDTPPSRNGSATRSPRSRRSDPPDSATRATRLASLALTGRLGRLHASSVCMQEVFALLHRLAPTDITVTLVGETGTGKDVLARTIHAESAQAKAPFTVFDCGAVAPNLVESELFGHERGSFTGALSAHAGAFERAHGGTLFLDEVGELPLSLQPRLLRALENRSVRRVGGTVDRPFSVRVVAATNRDLKLRVAEGLFREDLYFRLAAAVITVPPLRARLDDLRFLVPALLESLGRADLEVADEVFDVLRAQTWPGNVRQLKNALACALAFVTSEKLAAEHFRLSTFEADDADLDRLPLGGQPLARLERAAIKQTLALTGGMKVQAAQALGIAVSTLYDKLKKYEL